MEQILRVVLDKAGSLIDDSPSSRPCTRASARSN